MPRLRPRAVLTAADLPFSKATVSDGSGGIKAVGPAEAAAAPTATDPGQSNYLGRLVAYIPAEIIAVYQTIESFLARDKGDQPSDMAASLPAVPLASEDTLLVSGLVLLILTPCWFYFSTGAKGETPAWHQIVNATVAFAIWLLVSGNPVVRWLPHWDGVYGSAAMVVAVLLIFPLIEMMARKWAPAATPELPV